MKPDTIRTIRIRTIRTCDEEIKIYRAPREGQFKVRYRNRHGANCSGHVCAKWLNARKEAGNDLKE